MARLTPKQALDSKKTFYAKRGQQNGYYPIEKFVWDKEQQAYEQFVQKGDGWYSWGFAYLTPLMVGGDTTINNYGWWLYIFEHNSFILSDEPMSNNKKFNLE